ncbi:hypothetical protein Zmor_007865 [Zophobas morio]|uniref:Odorant receptor n=1 Tax=Zophobas morio TaxID=2755281 RepID=A0AA38MP64_9CUCU|nr:hypothetical protein Zmor_007865 [Zophobas morio]
MDQTQSYDWNATFKPNLRVMRKLGLWPEGKGSYKLELYTIYATFMVTFFPACHIIAQFIAVYFVEDLQSAVAIIYVSLIEIIASIKIYFTMRRTSVIKKCMETFKKDWFQPKNQDQKLIILENFKLWNFVFKMLYASCFSCTFFWFLPLLLGERENLPFIAWFPFDYSKPPYFELVYFYQILCTIYLCLVHVSVDTTIFGLKVCIGCQFDMLSDNLRRFASVADGSQNGTPLENLIKCVIHRKEILKFVESCGQYFNMILFWHLIISGVSIGITMFQLTLLKPLSSEFLSILWYGIAITSEISMYCWFGNEVKVKSNLVSYAAFESDWTSLPNDVKRSLMIFTQKLIEPLRISVFNLFDLSLETFKRIMKTAWSYFTLLTQLNSS